MTSTRAYGPSARRSHPGTCRRPRRWARRGKEKGKDKRTTPTTRTCSGLTLAKPPRTPGTRPTTRTRTADSHRGRCPPHPCPRAAGHPRATGRSPPRLSARGRMSPTTSTWSTRTRTGASSRGSARRRSRRSSAGSRKPRARAPRRVPRSAPPSTPSRRARGRRRLRTEPSSRTSPPTRARRWSTGARRRRGPGRWRRG